MSESLSLTFCMSQRGVLVAPQIPTLKLEVESLKLKDVCKFKVDSFSSSSSGEEMKRVFGFASTHFWNSTLALEDLAPPTKRTMSFSREKACNSATRFATLRQIVSWYSKDRSAVGPASSVRPLTL